MMRHACGLLALLLTLASADAHADSVLVLPAVGVGAPAPDPVVVLKVGELLAASSRRAGMTEAKTGADSGAARVDLARGLYFDLKFEEALSNATAAVEHYRAHPELVGDGNKLIAAYVYAALSRQQLGKKAEADALLLSALTLKPDLQLSDAEYPPTAISALDRVRLTLASRPRATLTISTSPAFGRVLVDGKPAGDAPVVLEDVLAGEHFVQVTKDGFKPRHAWVTVSAPSTELPFTLAPNKVESLSAELARLVSSGANAQVEQTAALLAAEAGVDAVVLTAVGRIAERYVVVAARVPIKGTSTRVHTSLALDLFDAAPALDRVAQALAAHATPGPDAIGPAATSKGLDFATRWMGLLPPPPAAVAFVAPIEALPPPPPVTPLWKKPWVWGVIVGVVAAGAGTAYLLTRPAQAPPGLAVSVEFP